MFTLHSILKVSAAFVSTCIFWWYSFIVFCFELFYFVDMIIRAKLLRIKLVPYIEDL